MNASELSDDQLLAATRAGDRDAFAHLVTRHQQMVCALAFARTGSFAVSEDVAQETFLAAWRRVAKAGAPENFRAWLCGTVRNLAARFHRDADPISTLPADAADEHARDAREELAAREDEAVVWASLSELPEVYRDPLVLYFRQGQSTRQVAEALGLSEQAVRQRLSRGRAMLQEAVRARVESALIRSGPAKGFPIVVMAAIPAMTGSAQAAVIGAAAAKGSGLFGGASLMAIAGASSGVLMGFLGAWVGTKAALEEAESDTERKLILHAARIGTAVSVFFIACLLTFIAFSGAMLRSNPGLWGLGLGGSILLFTGWVTASALFYSSRIATVRRRERIRAGLDPAKPVIAARPDYRSRATFLGLPLVHISFGGSDGRLGVAKGWIAVGTVATSPFLAIGALAFGGVSIGGIGVGLLCWAGLGVGGFSFSGFSLGGIAIGGLAAGYIAYGGLAWGWKLAMGGQAFAREFAVGSHAQALHANDAIARAVAEQGWLFPAMRWAVEHAWIAQLLIVLPILHIMLRFGRRRATGR